MFELKCGDRTNEYVLSHLKTSIERNKAEELLTQIRFQALQDKIDNYDVENSVDNWELIEAGITLADEIYGKQVTEDVANNMWFQWCVNRYNEDELKVKSYQVAEDLMRKTKNDYRRLLNSLQSDGDYAAKNYSDFFGVVEGSILWFNIPCKRLKLDNELMFIPDMDNDAKITLSIGSRGGEYVDNISMGRMFIGMTLNDAGKRSTGFIKQEPTDFFKKIDMNQYGEEILGNVWQASKPLDIGQIGQVLQFDNRTTLIRFLYEDDAKKAIDSGVLEVSKRFGSDPLVADYKPKGDYFVRQVTNGGEERLLPMFK